MILKGLERWLSGYKYEDESSIPRNHMKTERHAATSDPGTQDAGTGVPGPNWQANPAGVNKLLVQ